MQALYLPIKHSHLMFVVLSLVLFNLQFWLKVKNPNVKLVLPLRIVPHINNTLLLLTGILLIVMASWSPFANAWLGVKLLVVVAYIGLGVVAQKSQPRSRKSWVFYALAMLAFLVAFCLARYKLI